jgi:hypothetical protein
MDGLKMSYCKNCGKKLEDGIVICPYCQSAQISFGDAKNKSIYVLNEISKRKKLIGLFLIVVIFGGGFLYWNSQKITIDETTSDGYYTGNYNLFTKSGTITFNYNKKYYIPNKDEYTSHINDGKFKINVNGKYTGSSYGHPFNSNINGRINNDGDVIASSYDDIDYNTQI